MAKSRLTTEIANIAVGISGDGELLDVLSAKCGAFASPGGAGSSRPSAKPFVRLTVSELDPAGRDPDLSVEEHEGVHHIASADFDCRVELSKRKGELKIRPDERAFNTFLRVLYSILLVRKEGFLIHAAGLERDGEGYVFAGRSSSGKTTIAKNAEGFRILSDELVAIRKAEKGFRVFSTPFNGELEKKTERLDADLKAVFFLDPVHGWHKVEPVDAGSFDIAASLLRNIFFFLKDSDSSQAVLRLCCKIGDGVSAFNAGYLDGVRIGDVVADI